MGDPFGFDEVCALPAVAVPECLLTRPDRFGGRRAEGLCVGTLQVASGRVVGMQAEDAPPQRLVLPKLTEPHVHLDKCHTIERLGPVGGDLAAALAAQFADKANWTAADLEARMRRGLRELAASGCGSVRTHIDWGDQPDVPPRAWEIARDLRSDARAMGLDLQLAALTGIDMMADAQAAQQIARRVARDGGVLGAFVLNHAQRKAGIANCFDVAAQFGLPLDVHVDEGLNPELDGLDIIEATARDRGFDGPLLCGHACALATRPAAEVRALADRLAETGVAVVSLPTTNLYLQGRRAGTPRDRGLTMIHDLRAAGVNVSLGSDNVRDAFCPLGQHNPLHSMALAVLSAHLDPPLTAHLPMITTQPQTAMGHSPRFVDTAPVSELIAFEVPDMTLLLSTPPAPRPLSALLSGDAPHD